MKVFGSKNIKIILLILLVMIPSLVVYNSYSKRNAELEKKIECLELVKKTPERGNARYIGISIAGYWEWVVEDYSNIVIDNKCTRPDDTEDCDAEKKYYQELYEEAKPLYERYHSSCLE